MNDLSSKKEETEKGRTISFIPRIYDKKKWIKNKKKKGLKFVDIIKNFLVLNY